VDLASGFDPAKDTIADLVHPNRAGAEKIAQRWSEALTKALR
jgi:lysophospholipase L1-like esterase